MFMGIITPPIKEENFDGKILLKQVSKISQNKQGKL
jgi:hypothetical protein